MSMIGRDSFKALIKYDLKDTPLIGEFPEVERLNRVVDLAISSAEKCMFGTMLEYFGDFVARSARFRRKIMDTQEEGLITSKESQDATIKIYNFTMDTVPDMLSSVLRSDCNCQGRNWPKRD